MIDKRTTRSGEARYEVRVRGTDGKEQSRTFRTKKEAERYERAHRAAIDSGVWIDPRAGRVTLAAWATEWQRTVVHLRPKTRKIYDVNLRNHILPELGDYELAKLTPSMLRAWLSDLTAKDGRRGKPIAAGTVAQAYRTLNRVLAAAVDDELIGRNPLHGVKPPRVEPEPMRFVTHEEVATLAASIDARYRALVYVAAYTGLRAGELIGLRRSHIDLLRRTITVVEQVRTSTVAMSSRRPRAPPVVGQSHCLGLSPTSWTGTSVSLRTRAPTPSCSRRPRAATCTSRTSASVSGSLRSRRQVSPHYESTTFATRALHLPSPPAPT
jgi:Phage integrase, N-terminal SAM-like domain/Phage integrase family